MFVASSGLYSFNTHYYVLGKGGLISSLNSRLYIIRRLKSHLPLKSVLKLVDGLFTSKAKTQIPKNKREFKKEN